MPPLQQIIFGLRIAYIGSWFMLASLAIMYCTGKAKGDFWYHQRHATFPLPLNPPVHNYNWSFQRQVFTRQSVALVHNKLALWAVWWELDV